MTLVVVSLVGLVAIKKFPLLPVPPIPPILPIVPILYLYHLYQPPPHSSRNSPSQDFLVQAQAASALGCGNRPYEDRWCDQRQHRRWLQQHGLHHAMREQLAPNDTEEHERFQDSWVTCNESLVRVFVGFFSLDFL